MPTRDSVVKTVRIPTKEWEEIEKNLNGQSFCSYVRGLNKGETPTMKELKVFLKGYGATVTELMKALKSGLESGALVYYDGKLTWGEYNMVMFIEACYDNGLDPQEVIDKATQKLWGI